jgi:LytR cell envelope-related transcriptional attenuator
MLSILAFSVQHEVEKYGAYVAVACFLGLALLSILYFAQAREVRRLRDWAGRAPERDAELEARVTAQAEEARRVRAGRPAQPARPATALSEDTQVTPPPTPAPVPAPATGGNGHVTAPPLSVPMGPRPATAAAVVAAAVEAAEAPAVTTEDEPEQAPAAAAAAGAPAPEAPAPVPAADEPPGPDTPAPDTSEDTGEEEAAAADGNGNGTGDVAAIPRATPAPATAAARRPAAQPLRQPQRSTTVPPRRPPARPAARPAAAASDGQRSHMRGILIGVAAGVVVLVVAVLAITQLGGSDKPTPVQPNTTETPQDASTTGASSTGSGPAKADTEVVILNGTTTDGLAAQAKTTLTQNGYSADKIPTDTGPNQATQQSTVYYATDRRRQALLVGRALKIDRIQAIDKATQTLADNSSDPPVKTDVVVVLGADQTP